MKTRLKGSFTIEASVIVPVILMVFALVLTMLFYYHDKNAVAAISHETLVVGCGREKITPSELEQYLQMRIRGKLLLFGRIDVDAKTEDDEITIECSAKKKGMSMRVKMSMRRTEPEQYIWNLRRVEKIKEGMKEEIGETQ